MIFACAYGLRTTAIQSIPGSVMLSTQRVSPRRSRASSLRSTAAPMYVVFVSVVAITPSYAVAAACTALTMFW